MSKDENEQEKGFSVKDRRRFSMDEKGDVIEKDSKGDGGEKTDAAPPPQETPPQSPPAPEEPSCDEIKDLPPMSFSTLVLSLSTQAMVSMGDLPDPISRQIVKNVPLAKQSIDLLGILEEKTRGNLAPEEETFLKTSLTDLRIRFVQVCKNA